MDATLPTASPSTHEQDGQPPVLRRDGGCLVPQIRHAKREGARPDDASVKKDEREGNGHAFCAERMQGEMQEIEPRGVHKVLQKLLVPPDDSRVGRSRHEEERRLSR